MTARAFDTDLDLGIDSLDLGVDDAYDPDAHLSSLVNLPDTTLPAPIHPDHTPLMPWPPRLPLDLALRPDEEAEILEAYGLTPEDLTRLSYSEAFRRDLAAARKTLSEKGLTFGNKCAAIAEDWLPELDTCLHDPKLAFGQKLSAFTTLTRLAGLEPKEAATTTSGGNQVNIQINLNP